MFLNITFFILPFLLYLGVAAQAAGLYVLALFIPSISLIFFTKKIIKKNENSIEVSYSSNLPLATCILGIVFLAMHLVFPLSNILNIFAPVGELISKYPRPNIDKFSKLFVSRFSSAFFIAGLFLVILSLYLRKTNIISPLNEYIKRSPSGNKRPSIFIYFTVGVLVSAVFLSIYVLNQYFTGFEYRAIGKTLSSDEMLANGKFRTFAFYGHPLSLAGVGLAYFVFYWYLSLKNIAIILNKSILKSKILLLNTFVFLLIVALNFLFIFTSGGRTALITSFVFFASTAIFTKFPGIFNKIKWAMLFGFVILAVYFLFNNPRINFIVASIINPQEHSSINLGSDNRWDFWQVHWRIIKDKFLIGQGNYWLDNYVRNSYYLELGYANLRDKFNAHNLYLEILANVGLLGFTFIAFIFSCYKKYLYKIAKINETSPQLIRAFIVAIYANLFHGITQNTYFDSNIALVYLAIMFVLLWNNIFSVE